MHKNNLLLLYGEKWKQYVKISRCISFPSSLVQIRADWLNGPPTQTFC